MSNSEYLRRGQKENRGEGRDNDILIHLTILDGTIREGFSEEVTWSRDRDGVRSRHSGSQGKGTAGKGPRWTGSVCLTPWGVEAPGLEQVSPGGTGVRRGGVWGRGPLGSWGRGCSGHPRQEAWGPTSTCIWEAVLGLAPVSLGREHQDDSHFTAGKMKAQERPDSPSLESRLSLCTLRPQPTPPRA